MYSQGGLPSFLRSITLNFPCFSCLGFHIRIKTGPWWTWTTNNKGCISQPRWTSFGGKGQVYSRSQGVLEWKVSMLVMSRG